MQINKFQGDLTDIFAKKEPLVLHLAAQVSVQWAAIIPLTRRSPVTPKRLYFYYQK